MIKLAANSSKQHSLVLAAKTGRWRTVIVGCLLPLQACILWASPAFSQVRFPVVPEGHGIGAHPEHGRHSHPCLSTWCCTFKDCRPLADGVVHVTRDGYSIPLPNGKRETVKFTDQRIRQPNRDCLGSEQWSEFIARDWGCYNEVDGEWRVRCFYPAPRGY